MVWPNCEVGVPSSKKGQRLNNCDKVTKLQTASFGLHHQGTTQCQFSKIGIHFFHILHGFRLCGFLLMDVCFFKEPECV